MTENQNIKAKMNLLELRVFNAMESSDATKNFFCFCFLCFGWTEISFKDRNISDTSCGDERKALNGRGQSLIRPPSLEFLFVLTKWIWWNQSRNENIRTRRRSCSSFIWNQPFHVWPLTCCTSFYPFLCLAWTHPPLLQDPIRPFVWHLLPAPCTPVRSVSHSLNFFILPPSLLICFYCSRWNTKNLLLPYSW